ncbi:MAG TPA: Rieske 2Fe-2S domain-containing protein [Mycobacterium sp.]|nr:Rieske 2Fe-2S domain-containing protein [Mycobacterium sp.]
MRRATVASRASQPPRGSAQPRAQATRTVAVKPGWLLVVQRDPRWIVLVLRGYLGFTFVYAGLSKVAGNFLDSSSPTSMHATLLAVRAQSPIGGLLGPVEHHSFAFGLLIAMGETAVGIGMLLGLFTRLAAVGGMLISLSLFLTVSWNATPWYTGADIVYLFAFTPVLLGGAGPLSADGWLATARASDSSVDPRSADLTRRIVVGGLAGIAGLIAIGVASVFRNGSSASSQPPAGSTRRPRAASPTSGPPTSSSTHPAGTAILAAGAVPVGGAAPATDPSTGDPIYVLQLQPGAYTALDRICPHQSCEVSFISASAGFECPCHLSTFDPSGAVTQGPAATGLTKIPVMKSGNQILRT